MSKRSVVVSLERVSVATVLTALAEFLGISAREGSVIVFAAFHIEVSDNTEYVAYGSEFLRTRGLTDDNPLWSELNQEHFFIDVSISLAFGEGWRPSLEILGDIVAKHLSLELNTRAALCIDDGYVPFGVYVAGRKVRDFAEQYAKCFEGRDWIPVKLCER